MYQLVCLSAEGERVTEGQFSTVEDALVRSENMGSRWFWHPLHVVTGKVKIIDLPDEFETQDGVLSLRGFKGRHIKSLIKFLKDN